MSSIQEVLRRSSRAIQAGMTTSPVVAITGPRTAGKSTLARSVISQLRGTFIDLDDPSVRSLARADPTAFVRNLPEPVVLDEFQRAPDLLSAIKSQLNRDRRPGRFVLTGSARHDLVPELTDFLTGRVELHTLWPFAVAERKPGAESFIDRLFGGVLPARRAPAMTRTELVGLVLQGGYPIAVSLPVSARTRWFANLTTLITQRLGEDVIPVRRTRVAHRFLQLAAAQTAQILNAAALGQKMELSRDQAAHYLRLLELSYLIVVLPAWSVNLSTRVTKRPKLHLVDSGLTAYLQGTSERQISAIDPTAVTRFGALLETFVVTEVIKQLGWSSQQAVPYHFRTADGLEVDVVLEASDGRVVGIEVKAAHSVNPRDTRGLEHLRDRLGKQFVAGVVLNCGSHTQRLSDRILVAPVDSLWVD